MSRWQALAARVPHYVDRQLLRWGGAALLAGALGFILLGTTPTRVAADSAAAAGWAVPEVDAGLPADAQAAWRQAVWASQPATVADLTATPQPTLLGIVRTAAGRVAVFQLADGSRVRAATGERLPGGAEITALDATRATWRDADGQVHEARLLDARSL